MHCQILQRALEFVFHPLLVVLVLPSQLIMYQSYLGHIDWWKYNLVSKWLFFFGKKYVSIKTFFFSKIFSPPFPGLYRQYCLTEILQPKASSSSWSKPNKFAFFCWASHIRCLKCKMISLMFMLMLYMVSDDAFCCSASPFISVIKIPDLQMQYSLLLKRGTWSNKK